MRIAVADTQSPFIRGGAEALAAGLVDALRCAGHTTELVTLPFRFHPPSEVLRTMAAWSNEDFNAFDCGPMDAVVCLRFPTYYLRHPNRIVWLLHQHRAVYELYGNGREAADPKSGLENLRERILEQDTRHLREARAVFTIAGRVSERLRANNGIESQPVYHPPAHAERYYSGEQLPYIFAPSRLESLKRQELLIRAMAHVRAPVAAIIAGDGGIRPKLEALIDELGVRDRVRLLGYVDFEEMLSWYANALAVFFGPIDEDYGYVTLEAMLASKPVITCTDSGGPLEFVLQEETGFIVEPSPAAIADQIEGLYARPSRARELGANGRNRYFAMEIGWSNIVHAITSNAR